MNRTVKHFLVLTCLMFISFILQAQTNIVVIKLPNTVSIELPHNWVVFSHNQRAELDSSVENIIDLTKQSQTPSGLPFAANYYVDGRTVGITNVRYYPTIDISQSDIRMAKLPFVRELDAKLKSDIINSSKITGTILTSWEGTEKRVINGLTTFITEYHRESIVNGIFRVRLVRVFAGKNSFTLTVSYLESSKDNLRNITNKIISSLKIKYFNDTSELFKYSIDNKFEAAFPSKPQFIGKIGEGIIKHKGYNFVDDNNFIVYTAVYQIGKNYFAKNDIQKALRNYVLGNVNLLSAELKSIKHKIVNGNDSALFYMNFQHQGIFVRKYGVVSYKNGQFFQWSVQDMPSLSKLEASHIFKKYVGLFSVK